MSNSCGLSSLSTCRTPIADPQFSGLHVLPQSGSSSETESGGILPLALDMTNRIHIFVILVARCGSHQEMSFGGQFPAVILGSRRVTPSFPEGCRAGNVLANSLLFHILVAKLPRIPGFLPSHCHNSPFLGGVAACGCRPRGLLWGARRVSFVLPDRVSGPALLAGRGSGLVSGSKGGILPIHSVDVGKALWDQANSSGWRIRFRPCCESL